MLSKKSKQLILLQGVMIRDRFSEERMFQAGLKRTFDLYRLRKERNCSRSHTDKSKEV